ncbi:MAG: T9SS type A sorting domain-containing protein [Bacteroidetes bacterium]|nr:T9SS type A sorting domain-containing protein [Bacteroidota bacterium]
MIKKILLLALFVPLFNYSSFGQAACTPDGQYTNTSTQRGIHPDTIVNFAPAYVGNPYSQTITVVIPQDTNSGPPFYIPFNWDSTVLTGVTGLPASLSLTYACWNANGFGNPTHCSWKGNSIGCAIITGTPVTADIGTHNLVFSIDNWLNGPGNQPATVLGYKIIVSPNTSVNENPKIQILLQNNPNPFDGISEIQFAAEDNGVAKFKVYNLIGTVVQQYDIAVKKGINNIELNSKDFDSGIYFYSLSHGSNAFTRKMIVNK